MSRAVRLEHDLCLRTVRRVYWTTEQLARPCAGGAGDAKGWVQDELLFSFRFDFGEPLRRRQPLLGWERVPCLRARLPVPSADYGRSLQRFTGRQGRRCPKSSRRRAYCGSADGSCSGGWQRGRATMAGKSGPGVLPFRTWWTPSAYSGRKLGTFRWAGSERSCS